MKKLTILPILCLVFFTSNAYGWELYWVNNYDTNEFQNQLLGADCDTPLSAGCTVQLIADGGDGIVNDPMEEFAGDPQACLDWLADGCPPVGDDFLVPSNYAPNPTCIIDYSGEPAYCPWILDGWFSSVYIWSDLPTPLNVYSRFFNAGCVDEPECVCNPIEPGDWYGVTGGEEHGQPFQFLSVVPDGAGFAFYLVHGGCTNTQIVIPEPTTILIGVTALLLAFFRRNK